jgi:hypothetical protein
MLRVRARTDLPWNLQWLVGLFAKESYLHHGKPVWRKLGPQHEADMEMKCFLYFWDQTDGPDMTGWWFGETVGGDRVLAFSPGGGFRGMPPCIGWRVPWNAAFDGYAIYVLFCNLAIAPFPSGWPQFERMEQLEEILAGRIALEQLEQFEQGQSD